VARSAPHGSSILVARVGLGQNGLLGRASQATRRFDHVVRAGAILQLRRVAARLLVEAHVAGSRPAGRTARSGRFSFSYEVEVDWCQAHTGGGEGAWPILPVDPPSGWP